jgi:predicted regulator of Ras-like GTPase activity (Roadblock/LC7/MglB family)
MTATLEVDLVLENLIKEFGESGLYFILITSENGAVIKSYISQDFNKTSIGLNMSQLYELAEEITTEIGIHAPDFNVIHSDNFYILSIKILGKIIIILVEDQLDFSKVFDIINSCIITN